jgi:hypothetical protein
MRLRASSDLSALEGPLAAAKAHWNALKLTLIRARAIANAAHKAVAGG